MLHHLVIVRKDFRAARQVVETLVRSGDVFDLLAKFARVDAVEFRRLVQPNEGIGVIPVSPGLSASVHDDEARCAVGKDLVREGHRRSARSDGQVINFDNALAH